jgi:hypothetical protein
LVFDWRLDRPSRRLAEDGESDSGGLETKWEASAVARLRDHFRNRHPKPRDPAEDERYVRQLTTPARRKAGRRETVPAWAAGNGNSKNNFRLKNEF